MFSLLSKEVLGFFSSFTGYLVMIVYLVANSLVLWIFPGSFNIMDSGYASLQSLFVISPWVFLFLVSAVTMRMISDEKRLGTIEILFTKPLSEMQIVLAKYFASVLLVLVSLLPTLFFFFSVYQLGNPLGNIDTGGTWGSYIGLFLLAAIYASIGLFASALTENQIVAFILSALLSLFMYKGFDVLSTLSVWGNSQNVILTLGISEHYKSMSRGVLDSRDLTYFAGVIIIFLLLTRTVLQSRKW